MTKRKLTIPILLVLTLGILSQSLVQFASASPEPWISIDPTSIIDTDLTPGEYFLIAVKTNYTGSDIWGYELTLTYDPLILSGTDVIN